MCAIDPAKTAFQSQAQLMTGSADDTVYLKLPAAGSKPFGVVQRDAAIGKKVTVMRGPGIVLPIESGAAIAPGAEVEVLADGRVVTATTGVKVGMCMRNVTAAGSNAPIILY